MPHPRNDISRNRANVSQYRSAGITAECGVRRIAKAAPQESSARTTLAPLNPPLTAEILTTSMPYKAAINFASAMLN
jgi:hypothetical protein